MIDRLIAADRERKVRVAVLGCSMEDVYVHGDLLPSQDGVQKFVEYRRISCPGGAAGAARQLFHWNADKTLISMIPFGPVLTYGNEPWNQVNCELGLDCRRLPIKERFLADDRIVFRRDLENGYGLDANGMQECRRLALAALRNMHFDAVLISDYEKGFVDEEMIGDAIDLCQTEKGIPCVADAKRDARVYDGAILKCNAEYAENIGISFPDRDGAGAVCTQGRKGPRVITLASSTQLPDAHPVICRNHVGAGDCFSAHLTLALAHGLPLEEAAAIAHSAGRVYVQHPHGRPPWPHEIRKDIDPVGGKVVLRVDLPALRRSVPGRVVFANGVFRAPHAGHAKMLQWARTQGDVLVVGINDDASAARLRDNRYVMPFADRVAILATMECVDWIVSYEEDDPVEVVKALKPAAIVKGDEYKGTDVPGEGLAEILFSPTFEAHKPARLIDALLQQIDAG